MMRIEDRRRLMLLVVVFFPVVLWLMAVKKTELLTGNKVKALYGFIKLTPERPILMGALAVGLLLGILFAWVIHKLTASEFKGAAFKNYLRGSKVVGLSELRTKDKNAKDGQVDIAGIPMPRNLEPLHLLIAGATGVGKSVAMLRMAWSALRRGDRLIVLDPNGDMLAKFYRPKDVILNPYDSRTEGWSLFNEIRNDYDFKRFALSIVPRGQSKESEEWAGYARLLLRECWRKLDLLGKRSVKELFYWATIADPKDLKKFLEGTDAESLFVGADRALASARFTLSTHLPEHMNMPNGSFSLREWLENPKGGNLFIPWREDQAEALKPLISAWVDVLCSAVLSLPPDKNRRLWLFIDELASMEKLASLEAALTKGRKHGLRVVAGLQAVSQLVEIYGEQMATTLRSCFRNLMVFACSVADPKTAEDMSKSLGTHEVERDRHGRSGDGSRTNRSRNEEHKEERIVFASQLTNLNDLEGYLALATDIPVAKFKLELQQFSEPNERFIPRGF